MNYNISLINNPNSRFQCSNCYLTFLEQAKAHSDATAITTSDGKQVSYIETLSQARSIGYSLRKSGIRPKHHVGILARPGIDTLIAGIAILMIGAAYVSLDPDHAPDRLSFMASDASLKVPSV